jgi:predicted acyltransferase
MSPGPEAAGAGRLTSLDVFRGATIAAMILVNNPGSWDAVYAPLRHADWNGWTLTDLIFPFFLWIVGVAMTLHWTGGEGRPVSLKMWLFDEVFSRVASPVNASLLYAIANVLVLNAVAWMLWRRKWFIRL